MTSLSDASQSLIYCFLAREAADVVLPCAHPLPSVAAIGTIAPEVLSSADLRQPFAEVGIGPVDAQVIDSPASLLDDDTWQLALVLSPYKHRAVSCCDHLGPRAERTGVVDTLIRTPAGVYGLNANSFAIGAACVELCGDRSPDRVLVIGTGATARSILVGVEAVFRDAKVGIVGRSPNRAEALVAEMASGQAVDRPESFAPQLVIQATTVGESNDREVLSMRLTGALRPGVRALDLNQRATSFLRGALSHGCIAMAGGLVQLLTNSMRAALLLPREYAGFDRTYVGSAGSAGERWSRISLHVNTRSSRGVIGDAGLRPTGSHAAGVDPAAILRGMDRLRDLAKDGLRAVPPSEFGDLAAACRTRMLETGDARGAVLAELFRGLDDWWNRVGGVPASLADQIDLVLRDHIGGVLDADSSADGHARALNLLKEVEAWKLPEREWFRRGYLTPFVAR